jgi:hypothetical protein
VNLVTLSCTVDQAIIILSREVFSCCWVIITASFGVKN